MEEGGRSIEPDALIEAVKASKGFPYLMQLVGYHSWAQQPEEETLTVDDVHLGIALARKNFTKRVLDATYFDLSPRDIEFLQAMLDDDKESRLADISARLEKPSNYTSTYKSRLIEHGIIGERGPYYVTFELPFFRDYLLERKGRLRKKL